MRLLRSLPFIAKHSVLLHGDFHPGNILAAERERWLVIDRKPMVGDLAFDPIQMLVQSDGEMAEPPTHAEVERRLIDVASRVDLDTERVGLWSIARCAEWSMWSLDHGGIVDAAIEYSWARTLDAILPI